MISWCIIIPKKSPFFHLGINSLFIARVVSTTDAFFGTIECLQRELHGFNQLVSYLDYRPLPKDARQDPESTRCNHPKTCPALFPLFLRQPLSPIPSRHQLLPCFLRYGRWKTRWGWEQTWESRHPRQDVCAGKVRVVFHFADQRKQLLHFQTLFRLFPWMLNPTRCDRIHTIFADCQHQ